jgi:hypothetical protein
VGVEKWPRRGPVVGHWCTRGWAGAKVAWSENPEMVEEISYAPIAKVPQAF